MPLEVINSILWAGFYVAWSVWAILFLLLVYFLFRKNYAAFKTVLLISLNTLVFVIGWAYILILAIIVNFSGGTVAELKRRAWNHFGEFALWSLFWVAMFGLLNYLYLRFISKKSDFRLIRTLAITELAFLILCSWLSCEHYYSGLLREINRHSGV